MHIDVKKLGRITGGAGHRITGRRRGTPRATDAAGVRRHSAGWECVHVAVDDATRLAYAEVLERRAAAPRIGFLRRALAFFERHGIRVEARHDRQRLALLSRCAHALACRERSLRHIRTRPRRPQTNGKVCVSASLAVARRGGEAHPHPGGLTQAKGVPAPVGLAFASTRRPRGWAGRRW